MEMINGAGMLVAAVPYMLGHQPEHSLVCLAMRNKQLVAALRTDLPEAHEIDETVAGMVHCAQSMQEADSIALVFIGKPQNEPDEDLCRRLLRETEEGLSKTSIEVLGALVTESARPGTRWRCVCGCDRGGVIPDIEDSSLGAALTDRGPALSREEQIAVVQPAAPHDLTRRAKMCLKSKPKPSPPSKGWERIKRVLAGRLDETRPLQDQEILQLAVDLRIPITRDACVSLAFGDTSRAAEDLFAELTREAPAPLFTEPAFLVSCFAIARGDGIIATAALDRVLNFNPSHRAARLMKTALGIRQPPRKLHEVLKQIGVDALDELERSR